MKADLAINFKFLTSQPLVPSLWTGLNPGGALGSLSMPRRIFCAEGGLPARWSPDRGLSAILLDQQPPSYSTNRGILLGHWPSGPRADCPRRAIALHCLQ